MHYITTVRPSLRKDPNKLWYIRKPKPKTSDEIETNVIKYLEDRVMLLEKGLHIDEINEECKNLIKFVMNEFELYKMIIKDHPGEINVEIRKELTLRMHACIEQVYSKDNVM